MKGKCKWFVIFDISELSGDVGAERASLCVFFGSSAVDAHDDWDRIRLHMSEWLFRMVSVFFCSWLAHIVCRRHISDEYGVCDDHYAQHDLVRSVWDLIAHVFVVAMLAI